jgi:hypothetical protein
MSKCSVSRCQANSRLHQLSLPSFAQACCGWCQSVQCQGVVQANSWLHQLSLPSFAQACCGWCQCSVSRCSSGKQLTASTLIALICTSMLWVMSKCSVSRWIEWSWWHLNKLTQRQWKAINIWRVYLHNVQKVLSTCILHTDPVINQDLSKVYQAAICAKYKSETDFENWKLGEDMLCV